MVTSSNNSSKAQHYSADDQIYQPKTNRLNTEVTQIENDNVAFGRSTPLNFSVASSIKIAKIKWFFKYQNISTRI